MRRTVLLILLVALASAAPVAEDANEKSIEELLKNVNPNENDIHDNDSVVPNISVNEKESQEEDTKEIIPTTEYSVESKSDINKDSETETVTESETVAEIDLDSKPVAELEVLQEEQSNNTTKTDSNVEIEEQLEPNFDTEIVNEPNDTIDVEATLVEADLGPWIIESPQYAIKFPEVTAELETTDFGETIIQDERYGNQEWPQRYAPGYPIIPESQQYEQAVFNMEDTPEIPINTFGSQESYEEFIPEMYDSGAIGPMGPAYQINDEQPSGEFIEIVPSVDAWGNTYPDPERFNEKLEVNQFGGDGMAQAIVDDIILEPIYYDQVPKIYDATPELLMDEELPLEMLEESDITDDLNENPEDNIELIVINEEMSDMPFNPIAGEAEQPQDSPIIPTAILQDTRPEVELLEIIDESGDAVIIEEILEKAYPMDEEDIVEEYLPVSEVSPDETFEQDDIVIGNSDESLLIPFDMMPPLIRDIEQATFPDMPILQEPTLMVIEDDQFSFNKGNEQRIYFAGEDRENIHISPQNVQSNPDFMVPNVYNQFSYGNQNYQPHSHNENIDHHGDIPHAHYHGDTPHAHYHGDIPHTHNEHQFNFDNAPNNFDNAPHNNNFDNAPQNHNFDDFSSSRKRDGAHIVPDMDNMEMPMTEMGDMEVFNSPMIASTNPESAPQITVILVSKPQEFKRIWSQLIRPMQQKQISPVDMPQIQGLLQDFKEVSQNQHRFNEINSHGPPQFGNMGRFPQSPNTNQFNQNFYGQHFNEQPMENYNAFQNMNFPPTQMFNSGMSPFRQNFNQQPNMGGMFPNLDFELTMEDLNQIQFEDMERENSFASQQQQQQRPNMGDMFPNLDIDLTMDDLKQIHLEDMEMENTFASPQPSSPYGPSQQPSSPYGPPMFPFSNNQQNWPNRYAPNYQEMNFGNNRQFYHQQNINRPFFIPS